LINSLCQAVKILSSILDDDQQLCDDDDEETPEQGVTRQHFVVSQKFRDAYACHLYMLFSVMFFMESEAKVLKTGGRRAESQEGEETVAMRAACADAMLVAAKSMGQNRNKLWKRGVPDETVVVLPCRIAYQMLESATGILARKAASGDVALAMIAATVDSCDALLNTSLAALMDMLHSYEHMASICAELCCMVSEKPTNRLAIELVKEIGRLDTHGQAEGNTGRASGIKYVAPFIWELALRRPRLVLANITHILPHLDSEPYCLRSAIVTALGHIVEHIGKSLRQGESSEATKESESSSRPNLEKSRGALLDILEARSHDVSSYTRSAVLKAWISLTQSGLPIERVIPVTVLAIDRLQDKTVMVRKQALQVSSYDFGVPVPSALYHLSLLTYA
jgi:condensin complex subunit 1